MLNYVNAWNGALKIFKVNEVFIVFLFLKSLEQGDPFFKFLYFPKDWNHGRRTVAMQYYKS